jgi:hypothetical protein
VDETSKAVKHLLRVKGIAWELKVDEKIWLRLPLWML